MYTNDKQKFLLKKDYSNLQFLQLNNVKLLKPKINLSNGGNYLKKENSAFKYNPPLVKCEDLLKNPKIKIFKRNQNEKKECLSPLPLNDTSSIMNSTTITNNTTHQANMRNKTITDKSIQIKNKTEKVSNYHKIRQIQTLQTINSNKRSLNHSFSSANKKTKGNDTLSIDFPYKKIKRLNRSLVSKKEGMMIIDDIIQGLTKLKTIIAKEESSEDENKNNRMLISSTSGEVIKKNKKKFNINNSSKINNTTIMKKTIDYDNLDASLSNESLIMRIGGKEKNRNRNSSVDYSSKRFEKGTIDNDDIFICERNKTPKNMKRRVINNESFNEMNKTNINYNKYYNNDDYILINKKNEANSFLYNKIKGEKSSMKVENFQFRVTTKNNKHERKNDTVKNYFKIEKPDSSRKLTEKKIKIDRYKSISDDPLANYEFVD